MSIEFIKEPHLAIYCGVMGCGKTKLALDLIESIYFKQFEYIIIICSTIRQNRTYLNRPWIKTDQNVWLIEPKGLLNDTIKHLSLLLIERPVLFIVDDMIANEGLNKKRSPLLDIAICCRHRQHSLWFLTQSYTSVPKNLRRLANMVYCWYQKERSDMRVIHEENEVLTRR